MKSKREQFQEETYKKLYNFSDGEDFMEATDHGLYTKYGMGGIVRCYQRSCNTDGLLGKLLTMVLEYIAIKTSDSSAYDSESLMLDSIVKCMDKAVDVTEQEYRFVEKEIKFQQQSHAKDNAESRQRLSIELMMKKERAHISRVAAAVIKAYFDEFIFGMLPSDECEGIEFVEYDSEKQSLGHPVFSHDPLGIDISDDLRDRSGFFIGLSNFANHYPNALLSLFRDCGDSHVVVKLWNEKEQKPFYALVDKDDTYFDWIIAGGNYVLWPGLVCKAVEQLGYDVYSDDPEELLITVTGQNYKDSAAEMLYNFEPETAKRSIDTSAYEAYYRCLYDISLAFFATGDLDSEGDDAYQTLFLAIRTSIGCVFDNFSDNIDNLNSIMDYLKQKSDEYRARDDVSGKRSRRLAVCDSIDQLYSIYKDPDLRYQPLRLFASPTGRKLSSK